MLCRTSNIFYTERIFSFGFSKIVPDLLTMVKFSWTPCFVILVIYIYVLFQIDLEVSYVLVKFLQNLKLCGFEL